jgi:hypothetical protein
MQKAKFALKLRAAHQMIGQDLVATLNIFLMIVGDEHKNTF